MVDVLQIPASCATSRFLPNKLRQSYRSMIVKGKGMSKNIEKQKHGTHARSLQKSSLSGWNLESEDCAKMCHTNLVNIQGAIMCQPQALTRPQWSADESGWLVTVAALEATSDVRRWRDNTKLCLQSRIPADFHRAFHFEPGRVNAPRTIR